MHVSRSLGARLDQVNSLLRFLQVENSLFELRVTGVGIACVTSGFYKCLCGDWPKKKEKKDWEPLI